VLWIDRPASAEELAARQVLKNWPIGEFRALACYLLTETAIFI
jgi:hypothetical protein